MLQRPPRRCLSTYWEKLVEMGHRCTYKQVLTYYHSLPRNVRDFAPSAIGPHAHRQNYTPYVIRDRRSIEPGRVWQGDGHQFHFFAAHPVTGSKHKFEMTRWIDIGSYKTVGYWISDCESGLTTLFSLADAIKRHNHVPDLLHVDPGPGFKNEVINDEWFGLKARLGFEIMFAKVGNARGKGDIEDSFRWLEEKVGRDFPTHDSVPQEYRRKFDSMIKHGKLQLPALQEVYQRIDAYHERTDNAPRKCFDGLTSNQVWEQREPNPLIVSIDDVLSHERPCKVSKNARVTLHGRVYDHPALAQYRLEQVRLQFDFENMSVVKVRTLEGRLICEATRVDAKTWLTDSRSEELRQNRVKGQKRRTRRRDEENESKAGRVISGAAMIDAMQAVEAPAAEQKSTTLAILDQRHSLHLPAKTATSGPHLKPVGPDSLARVAAHMQEEAEEQETADDRYTRACALERAEDLDGVDAQWLLIYQSSSEYSSRRLLAEEFQDDAGVSAPASDTTARFDDGFNTGE